MPANETNSRRKSVKGHKVKSSSSQTKHRNHEVSVSPEPESLEPPSTLEDLRKARLTYLTAPLDGKKRKMKYEYVKTVKVKEAAGSEVVREGSTVSKARSNARSGDRVTRSKPKKDEAPQQPVEDESQYVYGSPRKREHVPGAFEASNHTLNPIVEEDKKRPKSSRTSTRKTERRRTEPALQPEPAKSEVNTRDNSRNQQRSQPAAQQPRQRPIIRRNSTSALPGSFPKASEADSSTIASMSARKSGSIFGNLFGPKPQPVDRKVSCLTCGDEAQLVRTAKLPCTHRMCHSCLKRIFKLSVTDPAHMPPRCCTDQAISLKHVDFLFDQEFKENYNRKLKEYKTKNKIYCPARGCGEWIQPKHIKMEKGRKIGRCPKCKTYVCGICSQKMHKTRDCPKDPATKEFVETAKRAGWQKCYNCNAMVELKEGCNHMTCRCTAEFCMVCGLKWKSCDCPWFSYDQVDVLGDPVRYQQEMDRRRDQEQRDEAIARRMQALQLDDDRPMFMEWINMADGTGRHMDPNFVQQARDALTANYNQGNQAARGLWGTVLRERRPRARAVPARPAMPGGWDDGPQQFEQLPYNPRRHRVDVLDPAAQEQEPAVGENPEGVRVVRHRTHRRRATTIGTAPATDGFESRRLTAEERQQERQIREWANTPRE